MPTSSSRFARRFPEFPDDPKKLWYATAGAVCCTDTGPSLGAVCHLLGVTRDAYYKRQRRGDAEPAADAVVLAHVDALREVEPRKGTRKLHAALATTGVRVGRDWLFRALRTTGRLVKRKRRGTQTTYSRHAYTPAPNHLKTLTVTAPRQVVVSDITYLSLPRGVFVYLFLVTDLFSRHIVGWHLSHGLSHHAALQALDAAQQTLGDCLGIVHHSDRGTQPGLNRSSQQRMCL